MRLEDARKRLFDRNFFVGGRRRRAAAKRLAAVPGTAEVRPLLSALARRYLKPVDLLDALQQTSAEAEADKVEALWKAFAAAPHPALATVLAELGWPPEREIPVETACGVLEAAIEDAPPETLRAVAVLARALPFRDESVNDAMSGAWARTGSSELAALVLDARRRFGRDGVVTLARALGAGGRADAPIIALLRRLDVSEDAEQIEALWESFIKSPTPALGTALADLGWPPDRPRAMPTAREVLNLATEEAPAEVIGAVATFARTLPVEDEVMNDLVFGAWARSQSPELQELIVEQGRQPATPGFEALLALVTGRLERYEALEDRDGALLARAFALAPEPFRARFAQTVAASPDRAIKLAYRRALQGGELDAARAAENLKLIGDEDGLVEQTRALNLIQLLTLCERWANTAARPTNPKYRAAVDEAVAVYGRLGELEGEPAPALPEGMWDIFDYWIAEAPSDEKLRADLEEGDPFYTARALYLGHERGLVDADRLARARKSPDWPIRLVARMLDPTAILDGKEDHVIWVNALTGDTPLLTTPIGDSPEDYDRNMAELNGASGPLAPRTEALLRILCAFQRVFVAGGITVDDTTAAVDGRAVEVEDAPPEAWHEPHTGERGG